MGKLVPIRKPGARPAVVTNVKEAPAPEGATCVRPEMTAFERAFAEAAPNEGVDPKRLPKCGKPAVTAVTSTYEGGKIEMETFCQDCRPRYDPGFAREMKLIGVPLSHGEETGD
jgi:hypothetical protein